MNDARVTGRFYCLPNAGEFELHTEAGEVIYGRVSDDLFVDALQQFNGTGALCACIVRGTPPTDKEKERGMDYMQDIEQARQALEAAMQELEPLRGKHAGRRRQAAIIECDDASGYRIVGTQLPRTGHGEPS